MKKHLIIIPGGGDPKNGDYKKGFDLIKKEAEKIGFTSVKILKFPGHYSFSGDSEYLNQDTAANVLSAKLKKLEAQKTHYSIVARSYGCGVTMQVLLQNEFKYLQNVKLWGPTPILGMYKVILSDPKNIPYAATKGCILNKDTYYSCDPFEVQLMKYKGNISIDIGAGTLDKHCKPSFIQYLIEYIEPNPMISYHHISGLHHEVISFDERYFKFIFG